MEITVLDVVLETAICPICGTSYAMSKVVSDKCRENGQGFYCPNGHGLHFTQSENEKLMKALTAQVAQLTPKRAEKGRFAKRGG